jgi:hypothetical protein
MQKLLMMSCLFSGVSGLLASSNDTTGSMKATSKSAVSFGHFSDGDFLVGIPQIGNSRDSKTNDRLFRDSRVRELDALLRSKLSLNDEQVSSFIRQLSRCAGLEPLIMHTPTLPSHICIKEGENVVLPTKVLIAAAHVVNAERLLNGTWNYRLQQQENSVIEQHLARNPDSDVRKVTSEHGFYFTFDDK